MSEQLYILNDFTSFVIAIITILSAIIAVLQWKLRQIQNDTQRRTNTTNSSNKNQEDINRINERYISFEARLGDVEKEVSELRGAFDQHNRESRK